MKRTNITLYLTLLLSMVRINVWADKSGTCGDGVIWTLSDSTLTISYTGSGTGEMKDYYYNADPEYSYFDTDRPWGSLSSIKNVITNFLLLIP